MVCVTSKGSDQPAHMRSLIRAFTSHLNIRMIIKLLTEQHLVFLSLTGGYTGCSVYTCQNVTFLEITSASLPLHRTPRGSPVDLANKKHVCIYKPAHEISFLIM